MNTRLLASIVCVAGSCLTVSAWADDSKKDDQAKPAAKEAHAEKSAAPAPPVAKPVTLKTAAEPVKKGDGHGEVKGEVKPEPKTIKPVAGTVQPKAKPASKSETAVVEETLADTARTPDEALGLLREGNVRWVEGTPQNPQSGIMRRKITAEAGQKPFAVVLTCADSRIPVERVFDRGVGEVFVSRVAGNVAGTHEAGSIEYALEHLQAPVLVVMGHTRCGAVKATAENAQVSANIASILEPIKPAVERARKLNPSLEGGELVEAAVRENVWQSVFDLLKGSPLIVEGVRSGKVKVVGAVLDIGTGKVDWMGEHPWQEAIVGALTTRNGETPAKEAGSEERTAAAGQ